jgi:hypothetical protein
MAGLSVQFTVLCDGDAGSTLPASQFKATGGDRFSSNGYTEILRFQSPPDGSGGCTCSDHMSGMRCVVDDPLPPIMITKATRVKKGGDILITFSDDTVVLFHAKFLYDARNHEQNIQIVDPFEQ